jgi:ABC-2 type transport system permease protein
MKALSVAWKDLQILLKDRGMVIQLFLLPLLFIVVTSGALSAMAAGQDQGDTRIPLPVVDLDGGAAARTLLQGLDAAGGVQVQQYDRSEATALLNEHALDYVLTIPAAFTKDLAQNRTATLRLVSHPNANAARTESVRLVVEGVARDMALERQILTSLQQMGDMLADAPPEYQEAFAVERAQAQARSQFERASSQPLVAVRERIPTPEKGEEQEEMPSANLLAVPGYAVLFVFLTAQATAHSIYEEKKVGSFRRLLAAPISKASLLAGKMLPNFLTALIQTAVIFAFGAFGLPLLGLTSVSLGRDPLALALVVVLMALCSSALGLVIAAIARTENQIGGLSQVMLWVMAIVGGSIVPAFILEMFLGPLPSIVPHYWANRALDNVMIRGLTLSGVTTEMAALLGFSVLFFAIGLWRFEFE